MSTEDKHSQRPTDAMTAQPGASLDGSPGDATIIDDRLGPGTQVGAYEIDDELGRGAMGVVYGATHPVIGKRVAIKVLRHHGDTAAVERFVLEARAVNEIGHRNIVDIFDFGTLPDGRAYMVMDLLLGETLGARLARGPLSLGDAAAIASECGAALAAAHAKNIVHRDLKPDNIYLVAIPGSSRVAVKLLDFGLVKLMKVDATVRTKTGAVVGTADYMSPEQGRGRDVDHRTDLYALGVMLFQMLAGRLPYPRPSFLEALVAHAEEPVPSLQALVPSVPKQLAQLVEAMMAKDRYKRPNLVGIRAVLKKFKGPDAASESTSIAAVVPVPAPAPTRHGGPGPLNMLDTLRGPGVGATPARPVPAITPAALATPDPDDVRPTTEFVAVSTPVVQIPIGVPTPASSDDAADDGPIDPPTLIAPPLRTTDETAAIADPASVVPADPHDVTQLGARVTTTAPLIKVPKPPVSSPPSSPTSPSSPPQRSPSAPPQPAPSFAPRPSPSSPPQPSPSFAPMPSPSSPPQPSPSFGPMPSPGAEPAPILHVPAEFPPLAPGDPGTGTTEIRRTPRWLVPLIVVLVLGAIGAVLGLAL